MRLTPILSRVPETKINISLYSLQDINTSTIPGIMPPIRSANEERRYIVTSSLIDCASTQNYIYRNKTRAETTNRITWKSSPYDVDLWLWDANINPNFTCQCLSFREQLNCSAISWNLMTIGDKDTTNVSKQDCATRNEYTLHCSFYKNAICTKRTYGARWHCFVERNVSPLVRG